MKKIQKLILPVLFMVVIVIIYTFYFAKDGLGSFTDFDPNNTAVKEIKVKIMKDIEVRQNGNDIVFYAFDKNEKIMQINATVVLPNDFNDAETVTLKGHLSGNSFHAHEVLVD